VICPTPPGTSKLCCEPLKLKVCELVDGGSLIPWAWAGSAPATTSGLAYFSGKNELANAAPSRAVMALSSSHRLRLCLGFIFSLLRDGCINSAI
jgi:hypothetical protein